MMPSARKWLLYLVWFSFGWGTFLPGCVSHLGSRYPAELQRSFRPPDGNQGYPAGLVAIMSVMGA